MRINRWIIALAVISAGVFMFAGIGATDTEESKEVIELKWLKYDKGLELAAKENKLIMVDFYTNWCGYCKKMDRETFTDKTVAKYLSENFVIVKVNAESKETVATSDGNLSGKQLSQSFGVRGYPSYWFLKSNGEKIDKISGYAPPEKFINILRFIGDGYYETTTWKEYIEAQKSN